eukprot:m.13498 g.13498  ORF g.13498 m.13498 type:complete len:526 (-) comp9749_c0_seq1:57-1634(-)
MAEAYHGPGSKDAIELQMLLLEQQFGTTAVMVAKAMQWGGKTLKRIGELCPDLSEELVLESITILLQHDLIAFESPPKGKGGNLYRLMGWRIFMIARYPRILHFVGENYGALAELLIEELLLHGQIHMAHLFQNVQERNTSVTRRQIFASFNDLVENHFIMRKLGLFGSNVDEDSRYIREELPDEHTRSDSSSKGPPQKRAKLSSSSDVMPKVYWTVNLEQFHRNFLCEWAATTVEAKLGTATADVFRGLVSTCILDPQYHQDGHSRALSFEELKDNLPDPIVQSQEYKKTNGDAPARTSHNLHVSTLINYGCGFVTEQAAFLRVEFSAITKALRLRCIEEIIAAKFTKMHSRLFRLVVKRGFVEQNQVKEFALMGEKKAVKAHLNNLFSAQFLTLQEAPKRGERAAQQCYFFWTCDMYRVVRKQINRCYKAQANLTKRVMRERDAVEGLENKQKEVLAANSLDDLMEADQKRFRTNERKLEGLRAKLKNLETGILEIDAQIMILRDLDEVPLARRNPDHQFYVA